MFTCNENKETNGYAGLSQKKGLYKTEFVSIILVSDSWQES